MIGFWQVDETNNWAAGVFASLSIGWMIASLVISILAIIGLWKMFEKAGEPGWAAIIPFYNLYVLSKIALGNGWLFLLTLIPLVNVIYGIVLAFQTAKAFGGGILKGFGILFLAPIFYILIGFGSDRYIGPNGVPVAYSQPGYVPGGAYGAPGYQGQGYAPTQPIQGQGYAQPSGETYPTVTEYPELNGENQNKN